MHDDGVYALARYRTAFALVTNHRTIDQGDETTVARINLNANRSEKLRPWLTLTIPRTIIGDTCRYLDARLPGPVYRLVDRDLIDLVQLFLPRAGAINEQLVFNRAHLFLRNVNGYDFFFLWPLRDQVVCLQLGIGVGDVPELCRIAVLALRNHIESIVALDHSWRGGNVRKTAQHDGQEAPSVFVFGRDGFHIEIS